MESWGFIYIRMIQICWSPKNGSTEVKLPVSCKPKDTFTSLFVKIKIIIYIHICILYKLCVHKIKLISSSDM